MERCLPTDINLQHGFSGEEAEEEAMEADEVTCFRNGCRWWKLTVGTSVGTWKLSPEN